MVGEIREEEEEEEGREGKQEVRLLIVAILLPLLHRLWQIVCMWEMLIAIWMYASVPCPGHASNVFPDDLKLVVKFFQKGLPRAPHKINLIFVIFSKQQVFGGNSSPV